MEQEPVKGVTGVNLTAAQFRAQAAEAQKNAENLDAVQTSIQEEMAESCELATFNPLAIARRFDSIEKRVNRQGRDDTKANKEETETPRVESVEEISDEFLNKNPEFQISTLNALRSRLKDSDSPEDIIKKLQEAYPDHYLADEALDFLIKTTNPDSQLAKNLVLAKDIFNQMFKREITAGKNTNIEARTFSEQGLGSPTALRTLYQEVTGNPKESLELFHELSEKYDYERLTTVIKFLLHSLSADMKAKGPSIAKGELQMLFNETRAMQAILGIYRFFLSRMNLIVKEFERNDLAIPSKINFEILSKEFAKLIGERYPSIDKVMKIGAFLGLGDDLLAQIIIFTQFRDGLRQVSPRLFKSEKQRQDLLMTLLDALSDIEDELDEDEDEDEEE